MLHRVIQDFLSYCRLADFSHRSLLALAIRLNEFTDFLNSKLIRSIQKVSYLNLVAFVADFKNNANLECPHYRHNFLQFIAIKNKSVRSTNDRTLQLA